MSLKAAEEVDGEITRREPLKLSRALEVIRFASSSSALHFDTLTSHRTLQRDTLETSTGLPLFRSTLTRSPSFYTARSHNSRSSPSTTSLSAQRLRAIIQTEDIEGNVRVPQQVQKNLSSRRKSIRDGREKLE
jgi:hypothetical protein